MSVWTYCSVAMKNRMNREYERQRLAFVGAKTANALRHYGVLVPIACYGILAARFASAEQ